MTSETVERVSPGLIADFNRDGVVLLRDVFRPWVDGIRDAIEQNIASPSWRERTYRPDDGSTPFFQDYCVWQQFEGYRALVEDSPMAGLAAQLMESKTSRVFHDHILVKEPGNSVATPWHHDQPYYLVKGPCTVSFWVPVDPVPRERSIEYVAGSHQWGKQYQPTRFDGTPLYTDDASENVPDVESMRDEFNILGWDVTPGDAVAFNFNTLHGAPANGSAMRRRVISVRWVGDHACFAERPGRTSPAFPDLEYRDGEPFGGTLFPQLFPRRK